MGDEQKSNGATAEVAKEPEPIPFAEFLESTPPSQNIKITKLCTKEYPSSGMPYYSLDAPELHLHCTSNDCNGLRFFRHSAGDRRFSRAELAAHFYITYMCSNCRTTQKIYSLFVKRDDDETTGGYCYKFGEFPPYGPPTPSRLVRLLGNDRELFLKGRRCEIQGLGIGAFVYYRRVVEHQKNRILDEIIKVARKIGASEEIIATLENAKNESQFSKALASVRDAMPQALLINGHNPLFLLHRALSGGLHEQTDEMCLELAHHVRVVLADLSERLGQALKDEAELNAAVSRLMKDQ